MGQEILYCAGCQTQLRGSDFEKGAAFRQGAEGWCKKCAPESLKTPKPELAAPGTRRAVAPETRTPRRPYAPARSRSPVLLFLGLLLAALAAVVALIALSSSAPPERPAAKVDTKGPDPFVPPPPPSDTKVPEPVVSPATPPPPPDTKPPDPFVPPPAPGTKPPGAFVPPPASPPPPPPQIPAPPPPSAATTPAVPAEPLLYRRAWEAALDLASVRDHAGAVAALEAAAAPLKDPSLAAEAAADLELLRALAALHAEARQTLLKWPKSRKLAVAFYDYDRNLQREESAGARLDAHRLEIRRGPSTPYAVPEGEIHARSLVELSARGRSDKKVAALASLVEGEIPTSDAGLPERFRAWAEGLALRLADPALAKRDRDARYAFYEADMASGSPLFRADAALRMRKLLKEDVDVPWVRRNRAMIARLAEEGKDYVAAADALRGAGTFRLEIARSGSFWMSAEDSELARRVENYVEMDFSVLPGIAYRAWAQVGGCCAEVLAVVAQGTELASEAPLKQSVATTKTHASHGGRKQPSRWGWVEIPLPAYAAPGPKTLRLVTQQQGFAVAAMAVSAVREKPPGDVEPALARGPGPLGPTLGLAAWFRADAGVALDGGRVAQWVDQSGRHVVATPPAVASRPAMAFGALNNKPALRFDGVQSCLSFEMGVDGLNAMTIVLVAVPATDQRGFEYGKFAALQWKEYGPWGSVFLSPQQAAVPWRFGTAEFGNMPFWPRPGAPAAGPILLTARKDGPKEDLFAQGALVKSLAGKRAPVSHTQSAATIGAGESSRTEPPGFFAGDIAELLIYARALPEAERDAVERHLRSKYGF